MVQEDAVIYDIPLDAWRKDDFTALPVAGDGVNLGFIDAAHAGTSPHKLRTESIQGETEVETARTQFVLPAEYVAGQSVTFRMRAKCDTTSGGIPGTKTVDLACRKMGSGVDVFSADLVSTGAQTTVNNTYTDEDFVITPTTLSPGDVLDLKITSTLEETSGTDNVEHDICRTELLLDIKG